MLKVGLVGVGGISGVHIPAWESMEDVELVALCDVRPERMEPHPAQRHYTDYAEMLEREQLDIVDICLPTYLHADYAVAAMEKGIHVLCEKPISLKKEDVARVYGTAERNGVRFMVAQVLRFWPEYCYIKQLYDKGTYGKLLSGSMTRLGSYPAWSWDNWMMDEERSGLVPFDLHIHDLDFMVYAFGVPQNRICHRSKRPEQDYLHGLYVFDGFFITSEASWYAAPYPFTAEFRFQFENAVVAMEHGKLTVYEKGGQIVCPMEESKSGVEGVINLPKSDAYANEIRYFTDCVQQGVIPERVKPQELSCVLDILTSF